MGLTQNFQVNGDSNYQDIWEFSIFTYKLNDFNPVDKEALKSYTHSAPVPNRLIRVGTPTKERESDGEKIWIFTSFSTALASFSPEYLRFYIFLHVFMLLQMMNTMTSKSRPDRR